MDYREYKLYETVEQSVDRISALARCVDKLLVMAGGRCEELGVPREEWDKMRHELTIYFGDNLG